jgi:hypothetical protein
MERLTRRKMFSIGAASAMAAAIPAGPMLLNRGNDAALLAMITEAVQLNDRINDLRQQTYNIIHEFLPDGGYTNAQFGEAADIAEPRVGPLEDQSQASEQRVLALEARIKEAKAQTIEGAVERAELFAGEADCKDILLASLREIVARGGVA